MTYCCVLVRRIPGANQHLRNACCRACNSGKSPVTEHHQRNNMSDFPMSDTVRIMKVPRQLRNYWHTGLEVQIVGLGSYLCFQEADEP